MDYQQPALDDTQPKPPAQFVPPQRPMIVPDDPPVSGGPGCATWGCVSVIGMGFALAIVLLSAAAGWTSGRREADVYATATQNTSIIEQLNRIPADIASGNLEMVDRRLRALVTMTPGVAGVPELAQTATALYLTSLPTATPTATSTPLPVEATDEPADSPIPTAASGAQYDLAALLGDARTQVNTGQFADAYELLDVIAAVDPEFERADVRRLTGEALNGQARAMFNSNNPAQGIIWATRAEDLGVLQGDLSFELFAAVKWQDAQAALGLSYGQSINALQEIYNLGPGRYYDQAAQLLFDQYIAYGDAFVSDPTQGYCPAVQQYQNALSIFNSGVASSKRDNAASLCAQATPTLGAGVTPGTPDPNATPAAPAPVGQQPIAPVGQPGS